MDHTCFGAAALCLVLSLITPGHAEDAGRKADYVSRVTRGEGLMPWQEEGVSDEEVAFREKIEARKDRMPAEFASLFRLTDRTMTPSEYAVLHLDAAAVEEATASAAELELPEVYFPSLMTAILRHGAGPKSSALSLTFCPSGGHRHLDDLALYYLDSGQAILGDHGYLGDTPMNGWIKSTFSHNLVVVDDKQQVMGRGESARQPKLHLMATSPKVSVVEASTSQAYPQCEEYRRLVALLKGPDAHTFADRRTRRSGSSRSAPRRCSEGTSASPGGRQAGGARSRNTPTRPSRPARPGPPTGRSFPATARSTCSRTTGSTIPASRWRLSPIRPSPYAGSRCPT